jgi:hypothetical protein
LTPIKTTGKNVTLGISIYVSDGMKGDKRL